MTTTATCRICQHQTTFLRLGEKNGYDLVACRACGSVMVEPWPTAQELETYFGDIQPEVTHIPDHEKFLLGLEKKIASLSPAGTAGKRFLDVSCQNGYAVVTAKKLGFDARGIDARDFFIRFAQSKYPPELFQEMTAATLAATGAKADVIYCFEHFCQEREIDSFLAAISNLLSPGGLLYIEEPDGNHFNVPGKFSRWGLVFPPLNFAYLSKKGLAAALARHGFRVEKSMWSWRPWMRLIVRKSG